mmetsp:Transcript_3499/g.7098  ORF Transcript_3499/g.7098 Transcript_3499/m.7098 type:complete len:96 (+) Transcript_3499:28-315(+)
MPRLQADKHCSNLRFERYHDRQVSGAQMRNTKKQLLLTHPLLSSPPFLENWYSCAIMALRSIKRSSDVVSSGNFSAKFTNPYPALQQASQFSPGA